MVPWTADEDALLREQYFVLGLTETARSLGRPHTTVRLRLQLLGVPLKPRSQDQLKPGDVVGRLTLEERVYRIRPGTNKRRPYWRCVCVCGNKTEPCEYALRKGVSQSCGCRHDELASKRMSKYSADNRERTYKGFFNTLWSRYRWSALKRKLHFTLTRETFKSLIELPCHYCGDEPSQIMWQYKYKYTGIDRKDNTQGYVEENALPCCATCNVAKGTKSYAEFLEWRDRMVAHTLKYK